MKIRYSTITKIILCTLVLMHLCFFLIPLAGTSMFSTSYIPKTRMLLFLVMLLCALLTGAAYRCSSSKRFLFIELTLLGVCWIRGFLGAASEGVAWDDALAQIWPYLYPLMALPLLNLFCAKKWSIENAAKFLVIVTSIDTLVKALMSYYESLTGTILWPNLVIGQMGYRNGLYRINPSALSILVIPLAVWLIAKTARKSEKLICVLAIAVDVLYAYIIWQARSAVAYKTIIIIMILSLQRVNDKKKVLRIFILLIGIAIFVNTTIFNNFIASFSESNATYGGSTTARLNAVAYFLAQYLQKPFWGIGRLSTASRYAVGGGMLEDCGLLYGLVQFGVPMALFYIVSFSRGLYVAAKIKKSDTTDRLLCMSMTLLFVLFGINIDPFYGFNLAIPFYLAIIECLYYTSGLQRR